MKIFNKVKSIFWKPKTTEEIYLYEFHKKIHDDISDFSLPLQDWYSIPNQVKLMTTKQKFSSYIWYIMNYDIIKDDISYISNIGKRTKLFDEAFDFVSKIMNPNKQYHNIYHVEQVVKNLITLVITNILSSDRIIEKLNGYNREVFFIFMAAIFHDSFHAYGLPNVKNEELSSEIFKGWWKKKETIFYIENQFFSKGNDFCEFVEKAILFTAPSLRKDIINGKFSETDPRDMLVFKMLIDADIMSNISNYALLIYNSELLEDEINNYSSIGVKTTSKSLTNTFIMNMVPEGFISIPGKMYQDKFEYVKHMAEKDNIQ